MDQSIIAWEGMSGVKWLGNVDTDEVNASLHCDGNILYGQLHFQHREFVLQAVAHGLRAEGRIESENGEIYPVSVLLKGSDLELYLYNENRSAVKQSFLLQPQHRLKQPETSDADTWLDNQLVGTWLKVALQSDSVAGFSGVPQIRVMFYARGELHFSGKNALVHRAFSLNDKRSDTEWFQWQTRSEGDDRILFIQDHGQWLRYGRYFIEQERMLITHSDGEREFWKRQG